jgi:hypothetical protein
MTAAEWIRKMPKDLIKLAKHDPEAKKLLRKFRLDPKVMKSDPMKDVLGFIQLYGRSALGDHPDQVNAQALGNFYISEFGERYTSNIGTALVTDAAMKVINKAPGAVNIQTSATVVQVKNVANGVEILYVKNGELHKAFSKTAIFSAPLNVAQKTIVDFDKISPEAYKFVKNLEYRDYDVVNVHVKGQPWTTTYDLWVRNDKTYSQNAITDIIDGRWMDYKGGAISRVADDKGVLTVYRPKPKELYGKVFTDAQALDWADDTIKQMNDNLAPMIAKDGGEPIRVVAAEVNRWPNSVHVVKPGHFKAAKELQKPIGNIFLGNNNMGVPAVEEGLYRGYKAADKALKALEALEAESAKPPVGGMLSPVLPMSP